MIQAKKQKTSEAEEMSEKLRSETNTQEIAEEILKAARSCFAVYYGRIHAIWDHGRWWIQFDDDDEDVTRTFAVADCVSLSGNEYFGFEEV